MPLAIYNRKSNLVRTIIRDDHGGYRPSDGWELVPVNQLPPGWTQEPTAEPEPTITAETVDAAARLIDQPNTPESLATWAVMQEVIEELRAAQSGKPEPVRTDQELRQAVKQRLAAKLADVTRATM